MAVIDVLRPVSVLKVGAGTSVPSGTLAAVTSDDSDATYIDFNSADEGSNWSLRVGSHTPPANHQRHMIRGRVRIRSNAGTGSEDIDLGRGTEDYIEYDAISVTSTFTDRAGSWYSNAGYGLATAGALSDLNIGGGWPQDEDGGMNELRTAECYVDIDCRARPDYDAEVRDAAGVDRSGGTVTDTKQPTLYFGAVGYDSLPAADWYVQLDGVTIASGTGTPPTSVPITNNLDDGSYTAEFRVRSTIRTSDPFEHVQTITFAVENVVSSPSPPLLNVTEQDGGYLVSWVNPGGQGWDDDYVVAEVWRLDCTGNQRIATIPDGLNGSYLDLAIPQLDPQHALVDGVCTLTGETCSITYSVRYWGYVSTYVELPNAIPDDLILGWPGTVGTIPSGWSRVTALDGYFPRGSNGTGAPSATGGATSHTHSTPGHTHWVATHDHSVGGSTGTSNASTTSARFNGASQPQADQPHSHSRPARTGDAGGRESGGEDPDTSSANNDPPSRTVIWISSGGAQTEYPVGALAWAAESVSGWEADADSSSRFLKGAAAAANGGTNAGSATHTHTVDSHFHAGFSHDHGISSTGLSNPSSSQEAGTGGSNPRWLPRHTHPLNVLAGTTGNTSSNSGGATGTGFSEPPHRRLRVLRNTGGGIQTRIIGLYTGAISGLDALLTHCNGSNGTPDMRGQFCRDVGSGSVNTLGGIEMHSHSTPSHTHTLGAHSHSIDVGTSTTSSYQAPTSGDLGNSPTTSHDHSGGSTGTTSPAVSSSTSGTTNASSNLPVYKEVHFVRLDGIISGDPLAVPELRVSDYSSIQVPAFTYGDGMDRLATTSQKMAVVTDRSAAFPRLVADSVPLDGGLHTVSTTIPGEDLTLIIGVEGLPAINQLEELLSADRVYWSPVGGTPGWYAPGGWTVRAPAPDVKVLSIEMVRQPWPDTADPEDYL